MDLAAYRIVQEALTNAARHSDGSTAVVLISYGEHDVVVQVDDDGTSSGTPQANRTGNGIVGMTERACALGGHLEAGVGPGGGFRVRASLPIVRSEA